MLEYGMSYLWTSPIRLGNLLEDGTVPRKLHEWLEAYADDPRLISKPLSVTRQNTRYNESVLARPRRPQLIRIKKLLTARADQYARETLQDPLPKHVKETTFFFVVQHANNPVEAVFPHYHEKSDVGLVYYLTTPEDGSGQIVMFDPRGLVLRGGRALPKQMPAIQYSPRRGDLLILPRYVMHCTTTNTDPRHRKVITGLVRYDLPRKKAREDLYVTGRRNGYRSPPGARRA